MPVAVVLLKNKLFVCGTIQINRNQKENSVCDACGRPFPTTTKIYKKISGSKQGIVMPVAVFFFFNIFFQFENKFLMILLF